MAREILTKNLFLGSIEYFDIASGSYINVDQKVLVRKYKDKYIDVLNGAIYGECHETIYGTIYDGDIRVNNLKPIITNTSIINDAILTTLLNSDSNIIFIEQEKEDYITKLSTKSLYFVTLSNVINNGNPIRIIVKKEKDKYKDIFTGTSYYLDNQNYIDKNVSITIIRPLSDIIDFITIGGLETILKDYNNDYIVTDSKKFIKK